jgi:hypothetical protein
LRQQQNSQPNTEQGKQRLMPKHPQPHGLPP